MAEMLPSGFLEFKIEYSETKDLGIGAAVSSNYFSVGGYVWRILCYPHGSNESTEEYVAIFLELVGSSRRSKSKNVKAIFDAFMVGKDGELSCRDAGRTVNLYSSESFRGTRWGFSSIVKRSDLEPLYVANGWVTIMCGVIVVSTDDPKPPVPAPPPSDIGLHLGRLLDLSMATDVTFMVGRRAFPAHCAVLAARSPVFEAQLLGSMADDTVPSTRITVEDIHPAAFRVMLRFVYTDSWPAYAELGDSPTEMMLHLLAGADKYALNRLKLLCFQKLSEKVSVDTVGSILACAETYNCPELKQQCLEFFAVEENFKKAAFTDGFLILVQKFPSLAAELRRRVIGIQ